MGKSNPVLSSGKTVKTSIPFAISRAIKEISDSTGRVEADILREAIVHYIKSKHPELLEKTKLQIENEAKANYHYERFYDQYKKEQGFKENIPYIKRQIEDWSSKISELNKKIEGIEGKIRTIGMSKKKEKESLETELKTLKNELSVAIQNKTQNETWLTIGQYGV